MKMRYAKIAIATTTFAFVTLLSVDWSGPGGVSLSVENAQARVGRPLTPVSVAGVARRQYRRGAYGYGYGAGVVGAGLAAGAVGAATVAAATSPYGYYGDPYGAYAMAPDGMVGDNTYVLNGNFVSEADAVAYCAQRFRSYDAASRTFMSRSGERVSCPQ
jgi:hypothetical protein